MRPLEEADKNGWTVADFRVRMVAVDLGTQQIRTDGLLDQLSQRLIHRYQPSDWCLARSGWNHADWGRTVFSDESCFQLCPDDHRRCVWRRSGQRAEPAFTIACPTRLQQGIALQCADDVTITLHDIWSKFGKKYRRRPSGCFITLCYVVWQLTSRLEVGHLFIELVIL
ncbi:UNVERIFIED_CONTAM: hypothetical protein NCL1_51885 [Trichonephila clavipes]